MSFPTVFFLRTLVVAGLSALSCSAQIHVQGNTEHPQWIIDAGSMSYGIGVNEQKMLQTLYWGPRLPTDAMLAPAQAKPEHASFDPPIATTPLEYAAWGAGLFTEPALKVSSANGDRTLILLFQDAQVNNNRLEIRLRDSVQPILVHLYYQAYAQGVIARWTSIENAGKMPVRIEQAASATWNLPQGRGYALSWLTGQWGGEWQLHSAPLTTGIQVLESRRGSTSHQANPWFALSKTTQTTEKSGPVWFGELGWSGSWRMTIEDTSLDQVRVTAGYNPFDFAYLLEPGKQLETPHFYAGYTEQGQGEASRILHRFQQEEILPSHPQSRPRPILYNSWEATEFDVNEAGQLALLDQAARLGVERFVIDDGWFGARNTDHAGLGDWQINRTKFPHGLKPVIDKAHALGMDFGLWVEPEMINPDSDLYRAHPDWVMSFPQRQRTEARNQLVLNLAREDVKEFVFSTLDRLVTENDIAFLKWDYNRNWSEPGWMSASDADSALRMDKQKEIYIRYVENLYAILSELRKKHPGLEIESCSGGGGRVDTGILRYTDEVWPSDNTDALDRLSIQDGFTHAYSPQLMVSWVTDVPNFLDHRSIPLQFRFLTAMQGSLGIGGNLNRWSAEDMKTAARLVSFYKSIRTTVQKGRLYRLEEPQQSDSSSVAYVAPDGRQAVVLAYLHSQRYGAAYPTIALQGLEPTAFYTVHSLDAEKYSGQTRMQGLVLMAQGIQLHLEGDYDSTALVLEREKE